MNIIRPEADEADFDLQRDAFQRITEVIHRDGPSTPQRVERITGLSREVIVRTVNESSYLNWEPRLRLNGRGEAYIIISI